MMKLGALFLLAFMVASGAVADLNLNLEVGIRDETHSETRWPALSLVTDFGSASWIVRPEVGLAVGMTDIYGGNATELTAGIVHYWTRPKLRVHLGGGLSALSSVPGYGKGSTNGVCAHTGVGWPVGRKLELGLDLRSLWAESIEVNETEFSVGYLQISFLIGWRF